MMDYDSNNSLPPVWQTKCEAAVRETDPEKLAHLVTEAEDAIFARLQEIEGKATLERDAIEACIKTLRELQVKRLNFPKWENER
jgi:hypothetical protein